MILKMPKLYQEFHCIAQECTHCCCMNWEIGVDEESYEYYKQVPGEIGEKLRNSIKAGEQAHFIMEHGHCPFLTKEHLCEIYLNLGEESLCEVCTEYPRFLTDYNNVRERVLALSCEEVGRLVFENKEPITFLTVKMEGEIKEEQYFREEYYRLHSLKIQEMRDHCIAIIQNRDMLLDDRMEELLLYAKEVQRQIDQKTVDSFCWENKKVEKKGLNKTQQHEMFCNMMDIMLGLDDMQEEWTENMNNLLRVFYGEKRKDEYDRVTLQFSEYMKERSYEYEHLIVYFLYRYVIASVFDGIFYRKVLFCLVCVRIIQEMGKLHFFMNQNQFLVQDQVMVTRVFCQEVEHSLKSIHFIEQDRKSVV